jgi:uncharacterized protein involved in tolerance to divalent cations
MAILIIIAGLLNTCTILAQETTPILQEEHVASITRIVRHVAKGVIGPGQESLSPEQEALIAQISQELIQEATLVQAEQAQVTNDRSERNEMIRTVVLSVSKGIAIVIALLVLRAIIKAIGRGSTIESPDSPLGVIITTRTLDQAIALGKDVIDQKWAAGGSIAPTVQSLYRKDDKAYTAPEAMLMLKTTNKHLTEIVSLAEKSTHSTPEIIALSRSILPS